MSLPRSGHIYLDLKDDRAVLASVVWKGAAGRLDIQPQEGDEVIAEGRLTTFPGQSKYQLIIERLSYAGEGALLAKLERLRKALAAEGLFDDTRKRPIPYLPRVIGVVTSPSGAVIRDILHRLAERFPVHVLVWPVAVQGAKCIPEVTAAIRGFSAMAPDGPMMPMAMAMLRMRRMRQRTTNQRLRGQRRMQRQPLPTRQRRQPLRIQVGTATTAKGDRITQEVRT